MAPMITFQCVVTCEQEFKIHLLTVNQMYDPVPGAVNRSMITFPVRSFTIIKEKKHLEK